MKNFVLILVALVTVSSCNRTGGVSVVPLQKVTSSPDQTMKTSVSSKNIPDNLGLRTPDGFSENAIYVELEGSDGAKVNFNIFKDSYASIRSVLGDVKIDQIGKMNEYKAAYDGLVVRFQKDAPIVTDLTMKNNKYTISGGIKVGTSREDVYKILPDGFWRYKVPHQEDVVVDDPSYYYYLEFGWDVLPGSIGRGIRLHFNDKNSVDGIFLGNVGFYHGEE